MGCTARTSSGACREDNSGGGAPDCVTAITVAAFRSCDRSCHAANNCGLTSGAHHVDHSYPRPQPRADVRYCHRQHCLLATGSCPRALLQQEGPVKSSSSPKWGRVWKASVPATFVRRFTSARSIAGESLFFTLIASTVRPDRRDAGASRRCPQGRACRRVPRCQMRVR